MITEVKCILRFARRVGLVVGVVGHHGHHTLLAVLHAQFPQVYDDRQVASEVFSGQTTIDIDFLFAHDGLKVKFATVGRCLEAFTIPGNALIVASAAGLGRFEFHAVGSAHHLPGRIVETDGLSTGHIAQMEPPSGIEIPHLPALIRGGEKAGHRSLVGNGRQ